MRDERREHGAAAGAGDAGGSTYGAYHGNYGIYGSTQAGYPARAGAPGASSAATPYSPYYDLPYGTGYVRPTGWETVPMPSVDGAWRQPLSAQRASGAGTEQRPVARSPQSAGSGRQPKRASMPKEQAQRLARRLKRWAVALAVAGFGTFSGLVAFHQASASATQNSTGSTTSSSSSSQTSTPSNSSGSSSSTHSGGTSATNSAGSSSSSSSSPANSSSSQDNSGYFNQQGGDNFGSQPAFGQGHSGSGVS